MELSSITHAVTNISFMGAASKATDTTSSLGDGRKSQSSPKDSVSISQEGKDKAALSKSSGVTQESTSNNEPKNLDQLELKELQQLKRRDKEVRSHEQAHLSAAGRYAKGGASFTYQKGPDGGSYAIGGEVGIDVAKESSPEATITKMQAIKRAALAPATPSGADKRIAAQANAKESQARQELLQIDQEDFLQQDSTKNIEPKIQDANRNNAPEFIASSHSSLRTKLAAYEKMAAT